MTQIRKVNSQENYRLEVILENGNSVTLDLTSRLNTLRFGILRDEAIFRCAETDGVVIRWGNKLEISADEVFDLVRK